MIRKNYHHEQGFTITEVVVSALIFAIATAGVLATATSMRKPAVDSSEDVAAAFLAKRVLDDLRSQLDSVSWVQTQAAGGAFEIGQTYNLPPVVVDGISYQPSYTVVADPGGTQARKVNLTVDW